MAKTNKDPMATKNAGAYKGPDEIKPSRRSLENDPLSFIGHILEDGLKLSKLDFVESESESVAFCFLVFFSCFGYLLWCWRTWNWKCGSIDFKILNQVFDLSGVW